MKKGYVRKSNAEQAATVGNPKTSQGGAADSQAQNDIQLPVFGEPPAKQVFRKAKGVVPKVDQYSKGNVLGGIKGW